MCLAFPGKITETKKAKALVDFSGIKKEVSIFFVPEACVGDYVMVHAGFAIQKMTKEDAVDAIKLYDKVTKNEKSD